MPGIDLNLDLPDVTDTMAAMVAKTKICLAAIEDDLAPQVVVSEMNFNATLPLNGNGMTGVGYSTYVAGSVPTAAGSLYYSGGEFYAIDATGPVRITNLGALSIASVKGIGGDYGAVSNSALVYYDNASGEYRFFAGDGVTPAPLVSGYHTLATTTHFTRLRPSASISASYDLTFPTAAAAANGQVMLVSTAGVMTFGYQAVPGWKSPNPITVVVPSSAAISSGATPFTFSATPCIWTTTASSTAVVLFPIIMPVGGILIDWHVLWNKSTNGSTTIISQVVGSTSTGTAAAPAGAALQNSAAVSPGAVQLGQTGLTATLAAGNSWNILAQTNGVGSGDLICSATFSYYMP